MLADFGRVIGDADRALHIDGRPRQLFGFLVTALLDQNAGKPDDEFWGLRGVFSLRLKYFQKRAARVGLGFA